ncbi:hypothetical protein [Rhizobium mongolense]|uniref:hypothetical protein n=1 Tax=Rhizobium mongolense TaxID=57676 RepID=UPI0034A3AF8E
MPVQPIDYPGFIFGGVAEPLCLIMILALIVLTPPFSGTYCQRHLLADRRCSRGAALLVAAVAA